MPEKKMNIAYTNEIIREMSGIKDLSFGGIPNTAPMDKGERLLSRMYSIHFLLVYVTTGKNVETHLQHCGYKKDKLSSAWWKQFDHIRQNAAGRYSKNARYYIAASQFILRPEDNDLIQTGDVTAASRFNLATQCALLMSALHPEADHPFFKAAIGDMPEYIRKKKHPAFTQAPELTPEEWEQVEKICKGALEIYEQDISREAAEIIARYVAKEYGKKEESATIPRNFASLGNRLLDISDRQYQFALSVRPESPASVLPVPEDIMARLEFDEATGQLSVTDENDKALSTLSGRLEKWTSKEKVTASDFMFLRTALTAVYRNPETIDQNFVTVKRSELGKHMGADLSAGNAVDVLARLKPLEKLIGRTPDGSIYRVFTFLKYDADTETYSFGCPFINQVVLRLEGKNRVEYKSKAKGIIAYNAPYINYLLHSTLHKERNRRAVEIVIAITNLLLQRAGETTRKPAGRDHFEAHIRYSTLISYCPTLAASLEESADNSNKNRILKSAFSKAQTLLRTKTDAYSHFENLTIPDLIVTNSTLEETIHITFTGIKRAD